MIRHGVCVLAVVAATACHRAAETMPGLPDIPVYELAQRDVAAPVTITRVPHTDPWSDLGATRRVTLTANGADVRTLLLWLAREAGVSIVVSPDVSARVSVSFNDVPAAEAIRAIMAEARLSVLTSALQSPWPAVVFYRLPVNVNTASPQVIAASFGVSDDLAKWIVESRPR